MDEPLVDFPTEPLPAGHEADVGLSSNALVIDDALPDFETIYADYFDFVWRSARRLGVRERGLDDAVQDVFVVVYRRLGDFEGRSSLKTWLYGITRRVAKDHRRTIARKEPPSAPTDDLVAGSPSPRDQVARSEAAAIVAAILDGLPEDKREIFVLAELEEMTVPDIAAVLELNLNTAYSRLRTARAEFERGAARYRAKETSR